jgi:hypothetical protein
VGLKFGLELECFVFFFKLKKVKRLELENDLFSKKSKGLYLEWLF